MGKNFVEASTEIDELVSQREQILVKIANNVASAIVDRANNNKLNGTARDVDNLLKDLSDSEKYRVMLQTSISIAKHRANGGNKAENRSSRDTLFDRFK
jgi:Holliday junction resolvase RusA-like endonuclease